MQEKSKYNSLGEWRRAAPLVYASAKGKGILDQICDKFGWTIKHKTKPNKPIGFWNVKENCLEDAKQFKTKASWVKNNSSPCISARKNGWLDECCAHMIFNEKPIGYWNDKDLCISESKKYKTRSEFAKKNDSCYKSAKKNGWFEECCSHMTTVLKPIGYWNKETCKKEALKYSTKISWKNNSGGSYVSACKNDWIDECCLHMIITRKSYKNITKELCEIDAKNYQGRFEWQKKSRGIYIVALKNNWLDDCCNHMIKHKKHRCNKKIFLAYNPI